MYRTAAPSCCPTGRCSGASSARIGDFEPIDCISVAGDDLHFWYADAGSAELPSFVASHAQAFDEGTIQRLRRLSIAVIGASGTGSPVIEQLMRLGVGELVIVDDDHMEDRNVNRILNSTMRGRATRARRRSMCSAMPSSGRNWARASSACRRICGIRDVVREVAQCDVVFGCMDTVDGRYLLNALASYYTIAVLRYWRAS